MICFAEILMHVFEIYFYESVFLVRKMPLLSAVILVSAVKQTCIQFVFARISTGYGTVLRYLGPMKKL